MKPALSLLLKPVPIAIAILVAVCFTVFAAWLPNLHLITATMSNHSMTFLEKTHLVTSLIGSLKTNFTPFSRSLTLVTALFTGLQVSLVYLYFRRFFAFHRSLGVSALGIAASILGIGCASCGSVVITSLIGIGAATSILGFLPFRGEEFSFIGLALILIANYFTAKKLSEPFTCAPHHLPPVTSK